MEPGPHFRAWTCADWQRQLDWQRRADQGTLCDRSGCVIGRGAVVNECILANYARVRPAAKLERLLVFGNQCIQPTGEHFGIEEGGVGLVVDDARLPQEFAPEQQEFLQLARQIAH